MTNQQEKLLHEVNTNLKKVLANTPPTMWLTAGEVMKRTGWSREQLRHRRENGFIRYEATESFGKGCKAAVSYKYDASTIPAKL